MKTTAENLTKPLNDRNVEYLKSSDEIFEFVYKVADAKDLKDSTLRERMNVYWNANFKLHLSKRREFGRTE